MTDTQWTLKVRLAKLDKDAIDKKKSKWELGDFLTLSIEPHATVNMLKQRIAMIVMAHPKHQAINMEGGEVLDDIVKLDCIEGLRDGGKIDVSICVPPEKELPPVELSDDEGCVAEKEEEELPPAPAAEVLSKELGDAEMDQQGELKQQANDALEDGKLEVAVAKLTEALMLGGVSAMMVAKRAEILMKQKRYRAVVADATLALSLNPDSAKAYRVRGKARRCLGDYEGSYLDLSQAQNIDYDDGVAEVHQYVQKRMEKLKLKAKQDAKAAAAAAESA